MYFVGEMCAQISHLRMYVNYRFNNDLSFLWLSYWSKKMSRICAWSNPIWAYSRARALVNGLQKWDWRDRFLIVASFHCMHMSHICVFSYTSNFSWLGTYVVLIYTLAPYAHKNGSLRLSDSDGMNSFIISWSTKRNA